MYSSPKQVRELIRQEKITSNTSKILPGYEQANLVILPYEDAYDFMRFCIRNPKPCPLLEVCDKGSPAPSSFIGKDIDLRTDLPLYRIYRNGQLTDKVKNIRSLWNNDMVAFLIGCSFSFDNALTKADIKLKHIENNSNISMYNTNIKCQTAGKFSGNLVVSMRNMPKQDLEKAIEISSRFPLSHGKPIHIGKAEDIGINNISQPDYGDAVPINEGDITAFWACGVTPQAIAMNSKTPFMITHEPGHMLITDNKSL